MKEKLLENTRRWRKTKRGLVTNLYHKMKSRNTVEFDLEWLHNFARCKKFERLFSEWEKSNYNKQFKPSIDRISNKKGYLKNNIHWLSWAENRYKQSMERRSRKGPVLRMCGDNIIEKYASQREAIIKTGISQSCISLCLNGKAATAGGFAWKYENPDLLDNPER